jgi:hypothetical protein
MCYDKVQKTHFHFLSPIRTPSAYTPRMYNDTIRQYKVAVRYVVNTYTIVLFEYVKVVIHAYTLSM